MSNELNNIIGSMTDGVNEGVAIGGDRYPGTIYMDHLLRYQADPSVKMLVMLGEVRKVCCSDIVCTKESNFRWVAWKNTLYAKV